MNEQEMQFADPDWQSTGQVSAQDVNHIASSQAIINKAHIQKTLQIASEPYEQGYRGPVREQPISAGQPVAQPRQTTPTYTYAAQQPTRRRSNWWVWVFIIIVLVGLVSGFNGYHSSQAPRFSSVFPGQNFNSSPHMQYTSFAADHITQFQIINPTSAVHINVNDTNGDSIVIGATDFDPDAVGLTLSQGVATLDLSQAIGDNDLTITLPSSINILSLSSSFNDIAVSGFTGQLDAQTSTSGITLKNDNLSSQSSLHTDSGNILLESTTLRDVTTVSSNSGSITLDQSSLSGQVIITTDGNGDISLSGTFDPSGKYQFATDSGTIKLNLPGNTSMQIDHSGVASGQYHSIFADTTGNPPYASVEVETNSGVVDINMQDQN